MCRSKTLYNYLAGLLIGDGSLYRYRGNYYVYVYDSNKDFLETLRDEIQKTFKVKAHVLPKRNYYRLQVSSKRLYEEIHARMCKRVKSPTRSFIAGLADAEGTVYVDSKSGDIQHQ